MSANAETVHAYATTWTAPILNLSKPPTCIYQESPSLDTERKQDFVRQSKWCPDGSSALAQCESGHLEFLNLPPELLDVTLANPDVLKRMPRSRQASPVLDFAWYPSATCRDPASFCFVASVRECPVKLLDAADGRLRASYKIVDHRERQIAPHSLAFNPTCTKLYCGFEDAIEVFDVHYPGSGTRLHTTPSKKSRDGLKGIISALAFAQDLSSGVYAAGSLNPSPPTSSNIALFSEETGENPIMFVGEERDGGFGIRASTTQVKFNPTRPHLLYAAFRRHATIYCWDVRGDAGTPVQKLLPSSDMEHSGRDDSQPANPPFRSRRDRTNQRLRFDIDLSGKHLAIGNQGGDVHVFDLEAYEGAEQPSVGHPTIVSKPTLTYRAHDDAIGSVGFHPLRPLLLSVSGSRNFGEETSSDSEEEEESSGSEESEEERGQGEAAITAATHAGRLPPAIDNSVKVWEM